jgi:hypothetical protein
MGRDEAQRTSPAIEGAEGGDKVRARGNPAVDSKLHSTARTPCLRERPQLVQQVCMHAIV